MRRSVSANAVLQGIQTALNAVWPLILFPYVSRTLQVESLGRYNFADSIVGYFAMIAALGINTYAVRKGAGVRDDRDRAGDFCSQMFTIHILSTIFAYALLGIFLVSGIFSGYSALILVLSAEIFAQTLGSGWVFSIYEDYLYTLVESTAFRLLSIVLVFILIRTPNDVLAYALISAAVSLLENLVNFARARKFCRIRPLRDPGIKEHIVPILILFGSAVAAEIYVNSDITLLGIMKGDTDVGLYSVSSKVYSVVKRVLSAVMVVSVPRLSIYLKRGAQTEFRKLFTQLFNAVTALVLPAAVGIIMLSKEIVTAVAGSFYADAAGSLLLLGFSLVFSLYAWLYHNCVLIPSGKEKITLAASAVSAVVNIVLNIALIPVWGSEGAAFTTILSEMIMLAIGWRNGRKIAAPNRGYVRNIASSAAGCAVIIAVCLTVKFCLDSLPAVILCSTGFSVMGYAAVLLLLRNDFAIDAARRIFRKEN